MEIAIVIGAVACLLLLVCLVIWQRARSRSFRAYGDFDPTQFSIENMDAEARAGSGDVLLGPVMTAESYEESSNQDTSYENNYDEQTDSFESAMDSWDVDEPQGEGVAYSDANHDEYEQHATDEHDFEAHADDAEEFADDADKGAESVSEPYITESEKLVEDDDIFNEPYIGEMQVGVQADLPLRITNDGVEPDEHSATAFDYVEVDESIEFPDFLGSGSKVMYLLGWIPEYGDHVSRVQLLSLIRSFGEKFDLPVVLYGLQSSSEKWVNFEDDEVSARYSDLLFTMQLTQDGKVVDEQCWWRFYNMGEQIAESLSRAFFPSLSMNSAIKKSEQLAEAVENLNIQTVLILELESGAQISDRTLEYLAREYELCERDDGRAFDKLDILPQSTTPLYSMTKLDNEQFQHAHDPQDYGLVLSSDLPCVRDPIDSFDQMIKLAKELTNRLPLTLMDEQRHEISDSEVRLIRTHIEYFVDDMHYLGIDPGGEVALRLFDHKETQQTETENFDIANLSVER